MDLEVSIRRSSGKHKVRTPSNLCWHACMQRTQRVERFEMPPRISSVLLCVARAFLDVDEA